MTADFAPLIVSKRRTSIPDEEGTESRPAAAVIAAPAIGRTSIPDEEGTERKSEAKPTTSSIGESHVDPR